MIIKKHNQEASMLHHACLLLLRICCATQRTEPDLRSRRIACMSCMHLSCMHARLQETHGRDSLGMQFAALRPRERLNPAAKMHVSTAHYLRCALVPTWFLAVSCPSRYLPPPADSDG